MKNPLLLLERLKKRLEDFNTLTKVITCRGVDGELCFARVSVDGELCADCKEALISKAERHGAGRAPVPRFPRD